MRTRLSILVAFVMVVGLLAVSVTVADPSEAKAGISVPPTYANESDIPLDTVTRRDNSLATLDAVQAAIDVASSGETIQLEAGVYDFSAVVNPDNEACEFDFYNGLLPDGCVEFGPHRLQSKRDLHLAAYGVVVLGKSGLTIQGAVDKSGNPATTILGNDHPDAAVQVGNNNAAWYNMAFTVAGGSDNVTFRNLQFKQFWISITAQSHLAHPDFPGDVTDPNLAGGTAGLVVKNNVFEPTQWGVLLAGGHEHPVVSDNEFLMEHLSVGAAMSVWGAPGGEVLMDAQLKGNTITGSPDTNGIVVLWPYTNGGAIKDNTMTGVRYGVLLLNSRGWQVSGNRIDDAFSGITLWGASDHHITDNRVSGSTYGVWMEWGVEISETPTPRVQLIPADRNRLADNLLSHNILGIYLGAYARNNKLSENDVSDSSFAGYFLFGAEQWSGLTFGRASGNRIVDPRLGTADATVIDLTNCTGTVCEPIDYDLDGYFDEDGIDGINNDADTLWGFQLVDEDPVDLPNQLIGDGD